MKEYNWREERKKYQVGNSAEPSAAAQNRQPIPNTQQAGTGSGENSSRGNSNPFVKIAALIGLVAVLAIAVKIFWFSGMGNAQAPRQAAISSPVALKQQKMQSPDNITAKEKSFEQLAEEKKYAVGLVAIRVTENGSVKTTFPIGTAWAFSPTQFATNAHVANGLWKGRKSLLSKFSLENLLRSYNKGSFLDVVQLLGSILWNSAVATEKAKAEGILLKTHNVASIDILIQKLGAEKVKMLTQQQCEQLVLKSSGCPNKSAFIMKTGLALAQGKIAENRRTLEKTLTFETCILINQRVQKSFTVTHVQIHPAYSGTYSPDVAVLTVSQPHSYYFQLADMKTLKNLKTGRKICYLGFPMEDLFRNNVDHNSPIATFQEGNIVAISDFDLKMTTPENSYWIRHNLPSAGGASGSPIFDQTGKVIALLNSGNMFLVKDVTVASVDEIDNITRISGMKNKSVARIGHNAMINGAVRVDLLSGVGAKVPIEKWMLK